VRDKFAYPLEALRSAEGKLTAITQHVCPLQALDVIKADPSDNRILEQLCPTGDEQVTSSR
jgi:hypothetical protein